jgi:hypothetical protein
MPKSQQPTSDEVQQLMLNAQLRDALEPFLDESVDLLDMQRMPTPMENEFLASMLAWERAPVLAISEWFDPPLTLPHPDSLNDEQLSKQLGETIQRLYAERIVLDFTDHLSDRDLYCLIFRDILPSPEKKVDIPKNFLHWHCLDDSDEAETWLRFYATPEERAIWCQENDRDPPPSEPPPFPRTMPRKPK